VHGQSSAILARRDPNRRGAETCAILVPTPRDDYRRMRARS
jgi:hypothetical protein